MKAKFEITENFFWFCMTAGIVVGFLRCTTKQEAVIQLLIAILVYFYAKGATRYLFSDSLRRPS